MATNPRREAPNLFNLDPAAFRLNAGGRSFDRVQRIAPSRGVWNQTNQAGNPTDPYAIALRQIQAEQERVAGLQTQSADARAALQSKFDQYNAQIRAAETKLGSEVVGNIALAAIPVVGPITTAMKLAGKASDAIGSEGSALNDFITKSISGEAGDALNTFANLAGDAAKFASNLGNAVGDVISGGVIGDLGGRSFSNAVGGFIGGLFGSGGGGNPATGFQMGSNYFDSLLAGNPNSSAQELYDLYKNRWGAEGTWVPTPFNESTPVTTETYIPSLYEDTFGDGSDKFRYGRAGFESRLHAYALAEHQKKVDAFSTELTGSLTEAQGVLGTAQQQEADFQAQQDAAQQKLNQASQFRTDYQTSRELQRQMVEQNIQPQVQQSGQRLASTTLYGDTVHQQMMARNK